MVPSYLVRRSLCIVQFAERQQLGKKLSLIFLLENYGALQSKSMIIIIIVKCQWAFLNWPAFRANYFKWYFFSNEIILGFTKSQINDHLHHKKNYYHLLKMCSPIGWRRFNPPPSPSAKSPTFSRQSHLPIRSNCLPLCIFFSEPPFFDNITSLKYGINRNKTFRENYFFMISRLKTLHAVVICNTRLRFGLKDSLCSSASLPLIP